ncbi:MAG TPA: NusG domain II-containing protein [Firmicutes bacterium]|nr:NusG domain II-containing protein [Bacillota bacterium]
MLTRHDKILAIAIILVAILGFVFYTSFSGDEERQNRIVIEAMGEVVQVIPMDQLEPGKEIPITGPLGDSILEMGEDKVRLVDSPCPDHLCVYMGWISRPGEIIVCLPNMVMVRVEGEQEPERDGITR